MQPLNTIDGATLMTQPLTPIPFIIDSLLSQGLHILSGSPKVGKSWLALTLSVKIANGEDIWGMPVKKGTTLYLCLEDSTIRIQNRLLDVTEDAPDSVHFCTECACLGKGLEEQLEKFIADHPDTVLIIIDTLQMIRGSNENNYANDYRDLTALKKIADAHGIAILLIHHLRKKKEGEPFAWVSGTTGLIGAADGNFVLDQSDRSAQKATLFCVGRDIEYREITVQMDENHVWELVSDSRDDPDLLEDKIVPLLTVFMADKETFIGTPTELTQLLDPDGSMGISARTVSKKLLQNVEALSLRGISVLSRRSNGKRLVELHRADRADDSGTGSNDPVDPDHE